MNIAERDKYVINQMTLFKNQGMTDRQAAVETVRTSGLDFIVLPDQDVDGLYKDLIGLYTSASDWQARRTNAGL